MENLRKMELEAGKFVRDGLDSMEDWGHKEIEEDIEEADTPEKDLEE